jgi:hypothetical protein
MPRERLSAPDPSVVIQIGYEDKAPVIYVIASTEGQELRMMDWVRSQEGLATLVHQALELAEEARAA